MKKRLLIFGFSFLLSTFCFGTPVLFTMQSLTGQVNNRTILVQPDRVQNPLVIGTNIIPIYDFTLQPAQGQVETNLAPWGYTIKVDGWPRSAHIVVPDQINVVNAATLINTNQFSPLMIYLADTNTMRSIAMDVISTSTAPYAVQASAAQNGSLLASEIANQNFIAQVTPWLMPGTVSTSSVPWVVYKTVVSTNDGLGIGTNDYRAFPTLVYDAKNARLIGCWLTGYTHVQSNRVPVISTSLDGGRTWGQPVTLTNVFPVATDMRLGILNNGDLMGVCQQRTFPGGVFAYSPIYLVSSDDTFTTIRTNGFVTTSTNYMLSPNKPIQLAGGNILVGWYAPNSTPTTNGINISTNGGVNWDSKVIDTNGNELAFSQDNQGKVWAISRRASSIEVFSSADSGWTWTDEGMADVNSSGINQYASFPACIFQGRRLTIGFRCQPYGYANWYYSDSPPYTNGWKAILLDSHPSLYCSPVALSPGVTGWLQAFDSAATSTLGASSSSNAWITYYVTSNDGLGWRPQNADFPSIPVVWLKNSDIPASGRMTTWPNWGSGNYLFTNTATLGSISVPKITGDLTRLTWCTGYTNVHCGDQTALSSIWKTGTGTLIWLAGRTNNPDNCYIIDDAQGNASFTGFTAKRYGASIRISISNGSGTYADYYTSDGDNDITGAPHVIAVSFHGGIATYYEDGQRINGIDVATSGNQSYAASSSSWGQLSVGTYSSSTSTQGPDFMGELLVFTNALPASEVYSWMLKIKHF